MSRCHGVRRSDTGGDVASRRTRRARSTSGHLRRFSGGSETHHVPSSASAFESRIRRRCRHRQPAARQHHFSQYTGGLRFSAESASGYERLEPEDYVFNDTAPDRDDDRRNRWPIPSAGGQIAPLGSETSRAPTISDRLRQKQCAPKAPRERMSSADVPAAGRDDISPIPETRTPRPREGLVYRGRQVAAPMARNAHADRLPSGGAGSRTAGRHDDKGPQSRHLP